MIRTSSRSGMWPGLGTRAPAATGRCAALLATMGLALGLGGAGCASMDPDVLGEPPGACAAPDQTTACMSAGVHTTADTSSLDTLTPGGNLLGHLAAGGRDEYAFTANQGEGVFLRLVDVAGGPLVPTFTISGPSGTTVTSATGTTVASVSFAASATGTYTIAVRDASSAQVAGDYRLYFTRAPGANAGGALTPGGVLAAHLDEGALDSYTFTANQGESVFLRVVDVDNAAMTPAFTIYNPAGGVVVNALGASVASSSFAAPVTGSYTVVVYDWSTGFTGTGDYKLYFSRAPGANAGGLLAPGSVTLGHLDEGEIDSYTFTANQGEGVFLRLVDVAGGPLVPAFTVYGPSGAVVTATSSANVVNASFAAGATGTYTLVVYDVSSGLSATGDYRLYFTRAPGANAGGALTPGGAAFGHLDEGALDSYTFTAIAGDRVALRMTDLAAGPLVPAFTVYRPTGAVVVNALGSDVATTSFTVPVTGVYTVVAYDWSTGFTDTGDYELDFTRTPGP